MLRTKLRVTIDHDARLPRKAIATALRDGSHFFEREQQRLNGEAFVADVLLTSA
jgi:hypothetical protein